MIYKVQWPSALKAVAQVLVEANAYAESLHCSTWDFAVEISEFRELGVSRADLRYLAHLGLVEHANELPHGINDNRRFRATGKLTFCARSCFVLSEAGRLALADLAQMGSCANGHPKKISGASIPEQGNGKVRPTSKMKPFWDSTRLRLVFGDLVVKEYRKLALNQHRILTVFQEENWPERIDDPLPGTGGIEPKRRLHEAIAGLNRNLLNPVLHFSGDGKGRGVRWAAVVAKSKYVLPGR